MKEAMMCNVRLNVLLNKFLFDYDASVVIDVHSQLQCANKCLKGIVRNSGIWHASVVTDVHYFFTM